MFSYSEMLKSQHDSKFEQSNRSFLFKLDHENWPPLGPSSYSPVFASVQTLVSGHPPPLSTLSPRLTSCLHLSPVLAPNVGFTSTSNKAVVGCPIISSQSVQKIDNPYVASETVIPVRKGGWNLPVRGTLKGGGNLVYRRIQFYVFELNKMLIGTFRKIT